MILEKGPRPQDQDTICATVTPYGIGGVSMIRVSGSKTASIIQKVCAFFPQKPQSHQVYFGFLNYKDENIDEVILLYFEEGRSFTSEETIEICCHGNPVICEEILNILQDLGCRMAEKGEFTYRAFLSGRIDLVQAEAVLTLIESGSAQSKKQALRDLKGLFSNKIEELQTAAQEILTNVEAGIDFSEENLILFSSKQLLKKIEDLYQKSFSLTQNYKQGLCVRNGLKVGLFGPPNSGKSTLFNSLLEEDRAIVSKKKGTTRDQLKGDFFLKGQKICLMDTAGVCEPEDFIEQKGLEKTYQTLSSSDLCLFVLDLSSSSYEEELNHIFFYNKKNKEKNYCEKFYKEFVKKKQNHPEETILIFNKTDLVSPNKFLSSLKKKSPDLYKKIKDRNPIFLSAQKKEGLSQLKHIFIQFFQKGQEAINLPRHYQLLSEAYQSAQRALVLVRNQQTDSIPLELVAFEIRSFLNSTEQLLGQDVSTDVLNDIFKQFCIGK